MIRRIWPVLACSILIARGLFAADLTVADSAVIAALERARPGLPNAEIIRRIAADERLDLVVALASHQAQSMAGPGRFSWSPQDRLGVFLQDRGDSNRLYRLAVEAGPNDDCGARIERLTARDLVLSCVGEKWATYDNRKFVYDIRTKALASSFSYPPYWTARVLLGAGGARFVMANGGQLLLVDIDHASGDLRAAYSVEASRVLAQIPMAESSAGDRTLRTPAPVPDTIAAFGPGERFQLAKEKNKFGSEYPVIVERAGAAPKHYPLAQSDLRTWQQARPDDARFFAHPDQAEINEEIGPHQLVGERLWFGKTFYNSEGATGVGGFGYFDAATAAYRLYSPPEIQRWSVSAILVEADAVWLALYRRGEYGNNSGGLLRWDRASSRVRSYAVPDVVTAIARAGNAIYLGTTDGIDILRGETIASFFVDRGASDRYVIVERSGMAALP